MKIKKINRKQVKVVRYGHIVKYKVVIMRNTKLFLNEVETGLHGDMLSVFCLNYQINFLVFDFGKNN